MATTKKTPAAPVFAKIAENKKASFDYFFEERYEAGMVLEGWEVKAIREGKVQLTDGYVVIKNGELFLIGCQINPLGTASTHVRSSPSRRTPSLRPPTHHGHRPQTPNSNVAANFGTLAPLIGRPNVHSIRHLENQCISKTMAIANPAAPTMGYAGIFMNRGEYAMSVPTPYVDPPNPGATPNYNVINNAGRLRFLNNNDHAIIKAQHAATGLRKHLLLRAVGLHAHNATAFDRGVEPAVWPHGDVLRPRLGTQVDHVELGQLVVDCVRPGIARCSRRMPADRLDRDWPKAKISQPCQQQHTQNTEQLFHSASLVWLFTGQGSH